MNKQQWCEYHGILLEEADEFSWYLKNGCERITKVFNYDFIEWKKLNKIENLNNLFRR